MKKSPNWAPGVRGSVITAIRRARWPRGSRQRPVRRWSRCSWNQRRFSPIVVPGSRPRPLVRSRMPIPAVWKSTVPSTRSERIVTSRMRTMRLRGASPCQAIAKPPTPNACHRARVMSRQGGDMRSSVGVDVGGTFTDLVAREGSGRLRACKVPTTPANLARGVLNGLAAVRHAAGVPASVAHGTTVVTNAIVERRGARVGLVTTRGFRDVLEIARQSRLHLYDLRLPPKPEPLVERRLRLEVGERVGPDGAVLLPLALDELPAVVDALKREDVESVAVCLLHGYANPAHERALKAALAPHFAHLSVSSEINAEFREYERSSTTVLNAAVMPLASRYLDDLVARLAPADARCPSISCT